MKKILLVLKPIAIAALSELLSLRLEQHYRGFDTKILKDIEVIHFLFFYNIRIAIYEHASK
jgi:hypothetical protein